MAASALLATAAGKASAQGSWAPGATIAPQSIRVTPENVRFSNYLRDLAGPSTMMKVVGGGLIDELRGESGALTDDHEGLGEEIASRAAQNAIQVSVRHGVAAAMHLNTEYQPCECRGFLPKVEHALLETFTDRRPDGSRAVSVPAIAGAYAGSFSRLAWERDRSAADAALGATVSIGFSALFNVARELTGVGR
jgi:hypothetical protein